MEVVNKIRKYFFERDLNGRKQSIQVKRQSISYSDAKTIGIFFTATEARARSFSTDYAEELRKKGKQVFLLGYTEEKVDTTDFAFKAFSKKELNWAGVPRSSDLDSFLSRDLDILLVMDEESMQLAEYVSILSKAKFRIGTPNMSVEAYDLAFDAQNAEALTERARKIESFTNNAFVTHDEI